MRVYRASSLGYSLEALVAGHLGYAPVDPPEFMQRAYDEGNRLEPIVLDSLRMAGWEIAGEQEEVSLEVIPGQVSVLGHLDGIGGRAGQLDSVIEIKTMAHKGFMDFKVHGWDSNSALIEKYKWQASAYMLATGLPHTMVAWDKETEEIAIHARVEPFYTISDIASKLAVAEDYIERGLVPDGCEDFPCPYYYLHPPKDEVEAAGKELEDLMQAWLICDKAEKLAKETKDKKRAMILAMAGDQTAAKVKGECGVTVETYWQEEKEIVTKRRSGWVTRISGPRKGKGATE